jgi:hypothetical protein
MVLDTAAGIPESSSYISAMLIFFKPLLENKMFYHVQIHKRIPVNEGVYFLQVVNTILNDPRGWGMSFTRVPLEVLLKLPKKDTFIIRLTPAQKLGELYPEFADRQLSVANMTDRVIDINHCRWTQVCPNQSQLSLQQYHQYVITHEVGHMLGKDHPTDSELLGQKQAPVMIQQTLGIGSYKPNPWPTTFDKTGL